MKDSKKQYPSQTGVYAVKVKNGRGWDVFKTARLQISVGQAYHEGEKFKATIEWAKHRFDKVIICVNDTLQRYNYAYKSDLSSLDAFIKTESAGREWIERNLPTIRSLPNFEIHRWEDWRNKPEFSSEHQNVMDLYQRDPMVKDLLEHDVLEFWKRRVERNGEDAQNYSFAAFKQASTDYLLEETAAFFLMFKRDQAVDIYPGSVLLPCVLAQKYCEAAKWANLGERAFTRIDFSKNHDIANQNTAAQA